MLDYVLRPCDSSLLQSAVVPVSAGFGSCNVDAVVVEHQIGVADVQSCADIHELVEVHDRGLKTFAVTIIEKPVAAWEAAASREYRVRLHLGCVRRGRPLIAVSLFTPWVPQGCYTHGLPKPPLCQCVMQSGSAAHQSPVSET